MSINNLNTYLNIKDSHLRVVSGNVYAQAMNIGGINVETAHGLQSVSNTGNVTSNTLQFSNAITGFVTTANAQIGRDLIVSGNATVSTDLTVSANATVADTLTISEHLIASKEATVTGNLHVTTIRSDSNVVAEYTGPHDRPLRKYPEVALTSSAINSDYKGYTIQRSSDYTVTYGTVEKLFNNAEGSDVNSWVAGWNGTNGTYDAGTGEHSGTYHTPGSNNVEGTGVALFAGAPDGEWVSLQIPNGIRLDHVKIRARDHTDGVEQYPKDFEFWGSNNGTDWSLIKSFTNQSWPGQNNKGSYHVNSNILYNRIAMIITKLPPNVQYGTHCVFGQLEYYGHEEGSASLDTTLKSVYNVPATTGTQLDVYYDGQDYTQTSDFTGAGGVIDKAGGDQNGTAGTGVSFDTTYKAFVFDGTTDGVISDELPSTVTGAYVHSMSLWFKHSGTGNTLYTLAHIGDVNNAQSVMSDLLVYDTGKLRFGFYDNDSDTPDGIVTLNQWYHVVATYSGGTGNAHSRKIYVNGKEIPLTLSGAYNANSLSLPSDPMLYLGSQQGSLRLTGSIANFRLYSKALNADQVKELYEYQKDYFLGSKSQVTLYKGHLGVGVTEPSGQLELAGDERIQEYPPGPMDDYETLIPGHGVFCAYAPNESANSNNPFAWKAFNKETSGSKWWFEHDSAPTYQYGTSSDTSQYANPVNIPYTTNGIVGLYIELKFPYAINLKSYALTARSTDALIGRRMPEEGVLFGSNDGVTWTAIHNHKDTGGNYTTGIGPRHFNVDDTSKSTYSYFRLVTTKLFDRSGGGGTSGETPNIGELKFFGTPGPTTLDKGSLTLGRSLDVPRVSRYDVDTETPRPEKLVVDYDTTVNSSPTDISGKGNHGVFKNDSEYSPADKAFKFDGDNDYIQTGSGSNVISGSAPPFTASVWVNNNSSDSTYASVFSIEPDTYGTNTNVWFYILSGKPTLQFENNYVEFYEPGTSTGGATRNIWHHLVVSYNGNSTIGGRRCWLNGVEQTSSAVAGSGNLTLGTTRLTLGVLYYGNNHVNDMTGKISNFKLYNVALEPSEVQKLYRLGRTGRSMVISDTAVGIGKVPEAQLDVRGNIKCDVIMPNVIAFSAYRTSPLALGDQSTTGSFQANNTYYNYGNAYNTSNGQFKAPIDGVYHINWNAFTNQTATSTSRIFLLKNGTIEFQKGNSIERHGNGISVDIHLNAGDYVTINGSSSYPLYFHGHAAHHHYSGYLVYAT